MKCTLEVECTPLEARQFFGLPDVQPLQATVMAEVEKKMLAEMERFSPEGVLKNWLSMFSQSPEHATTGVLQDDVHRAQPHEGVRSTVGPSGRRRAPKRSVRAASRVIIVGRQHASSTGASKCPSSMGPERGLCAVSNDRRTCLSSRPCGSPSHGRSGAPPALKRSSKLWIFSDEARGPQVASSDASLPRRSAGTPEYLQNALKVMTVRVSAIPGINCTLSPTKWPMSVSSDT